MSLRGECAYAVEYAYTVEWGGCGICVLHPCWAHAWVFRNDGSIDTCPDGRIYHLSFDWRTKALVSNEFHDCSAFHDTILAKACWQACKQHVSDQLYVYIRFPYNVS